MEENVLSPEAAYRELLKSNGLDNLMLPGNLARKSHDAMAAAGWFDGMTEELWQAYERTRKCSQYVTDAYAPLLTSLGREVEESIKTAGGTLDCEVFVGGFPLGEANACVGFPDKCTGVLILVNHGLIQLIYQVGKLFVLSYDWLCGLENGNGDIMVKVARHDADHATTLAGTLCWPSLGWTRADTIGGIAEIVLAYKHCGTVTKSPRQPLPNGARAATLASAVHSANKFVIAHEYAHILRGHLDGERTVLRTPSGTIDSVLRPRQRQEFEADELAATLVLAPIEWNSPGGEFRGNCAIAGISLMLWAAIFASMPYEDIHALSLKPGSETHPPPNARLLRLLDKLHAKQGKSITQMARVCAGWALDIASDVNVELRSRCE